MRRGRRIPTMPFTDRHRDRTRFPAVPNGRRGAAGTSSGAGSAGPAPEASPGARSCTARANDRTWSTSCRGGAGPRRARG